MSIDAIRDATRPLRRWLRGQTASSRPANATERAAALLLVVDGFGRLAQHLDPAKIQTVTERFSPSADSADLNRLLLRYGSNKTKGLNYHLAYADLLGPRRQQPLRILEIGLGTNNVDVPSNMGIDGRPGASLRAWRDYLPNAEIYGADIDRRVLFAEDRITTHWVDQTKPETLQALGAHGPFDVIIDDGLHRSDANVNTLAFALDALRPGGAIVIEDIQPRDAPLWRAIKRMLAPSYTAEYLADGRHGLFVAQH